MRRLIMAAAAVAALLAPFAVTSTASAAPPIDPPGLVHPPNLTAEQWAAKFPATAAAAAQVRAHGIGAVSPKGAKFDLMAATGPEPWGGHMWSSLDVSNPSLVHGCSAGVNTMTSIGTRYTQDAGHCFRNAGNGAYFVDPTNGVFQLGFDPTTGPQIGHHGAVANWSNAGGDNGWIRQSDDVAPNGTFSEAAVYDSRGAVNLVCACDPVVGVTGVSISAGHSERLIRNGLVTQVNKTSNFGAPVDAVTNQFEVRFNWSQNGCTIAGDSGSPVIGPNHEFYGTVSGALVTGGWCFVAVDQGRKSMQKVNQQLAPSDPSTT